MSYQIRHNSNHISIFSYWTILYYIIYIYLLYYILDLIDNRLNGYLEKWQEECTRLIDWLTEWLIVLNERKCGKSREKSCIVALSLDIENNTTINVYVYYLSIYIYVNTGI